MAQVQAYDWPGNVRELRNVVERAVYRWAGQEGPIEDIQFDPFESPWRPLPGQGVLPAMPGTCPRRPPDEAQVVVQRQLGFDPAETAPTSASPSPNMKKRSSPPRWKNAAGTSAPRRRR